jgi:DNA-binding LacI/PurR family transcriptional regulator
MAATSSGVARLQEVAKAARVSVSTASRALKNDPRISERTRERVQRHAERLNYRADLVARSLTLRRTFTVGLIVLDVGNPFFAGLARGIETALAEEGYIYLLGDSHGQAKRQREIARRLKERQVDGILFTVPHDPEVLAEKSIPIAGIGRCPPGIPYVSTDHVLGGLLATEHLIEAGYKRIGALLAEPSMLPVIDRRKGYRNAIAAAGRERVEIVCSAISYEAAYKGAQKLLASGVDAIVTISDTLAVAAMAAVLDAGRRVPEDVGIVGYDDTAMASWPFLALTSVAQPTSHLGEEAGRMILQRIRTPGEAVEPVTLAPSLIVRRSSHGPH